MLTIVTPAANHHLTTAAAVCRELGIDGEAVTAFLAGAIPQASDAVRTWCGRTFALETIRETFHAPEPLPSLLLSRWPLVAIDAATIGAVSLDLSEVEADLDCGSVYRLAANRRRLSWPAGRLVVDYRAGFILPDQEGRTLPHDIERAAIALVKGYWFSRDRDPTLRSEDVTGVGNLSYGLAGIGQGITLPPDVEGLLSPYRAHGMG
ncbi:hypothetical protein [Azorhizobium doebereinerae]|uniref:hypothetical protein n=1 Tax=Azorhizobium doebereinerae TaxID=281091 RepID=UPI000409FB92|nr:hypothetical protein [Azorhizobium doebereinerae]